MFDEARAFITNTDSIGIADWYVWRDEWPDWRNVNEVEGLLEPIYRMMRVSPPPPPKGTNEKSFDAKSAKRFTSEKSIKSVKNMESKTRAYTNLKEVEDFNVGGDDVLEIANEPSIRKVIEKNNNYPQIEEGPFTLTDGEFVVRGKKRFQKRYEITIEGPQKLTFKTHSRNISVGGISFEDSMPDWINGYFKVRISKPGSKQKIELMCCLVENQKKDERFRVAILPLENAKDEQSLEAWLAA